MGAAGAHSKGKVVAMRHPDSSTWLHRWPDLFDGLTAEQRRILITAVADNVLEAGDPAVQISRPSSTSCAVTPPLRSTSTQCAPAQPIDKPWRELSRSDLNQPSCRTKLNPTDIDS